MRRILQYFILLTLTWSCSSDNGSSPGMSDDVDPGPGPAAETFARGPMLANWADNIIVPAYTDFSEKLTRLSAGLETFKVEGNEANLVVLRTAWLEAYKALQHVDMFEIGPAEASGLRLNLNSYPSDTTLIESNASKGTYDLKLPSNRVAKGFPALDYLINGLGETDTSIVATLGSETAKSSYIPYMDAVLKDMRELSNQALSEWQQGYRDTFVNNDGASATASVDRFINDYIFYYEKFLRAGKMGIPLGVFSGNTLPGNLEGYYDADVSKALFLEGLNASQDFFNGKHFASEGKGESLATYLDTLNAVKGGEDLNKIINHQFDTAREQVTALGDFRTEIENNEPPTNMLLAYDEVQRIVPLLKVDMVSALSISIAYVDSDGD